MSKQPERPEVVLGVDTHLEMHVAAVVDAALGRLVATQSFASSTAGYMQMIRWASSLGALRRAGVEGTGTYGAGLARALLAHGIAVLEVNRPDRGRRRLRGKSDPTDAESAARAVLAGEATAQPKAQSGAVEAMRVVCTARRSAVKARTQAINQLRALLVTAPDAMRAELLRPTPERCVHGCLRLEPGQASAELQRTLLATLRLLARRWIALTEELRELDAALSQLTRRAAGGDPASI